MNNMFPTTPEPINEPVRSYAPGSPERASLRSTMKTMRDEHIDIPAFIDGKEVRTGTTLEIRAPHEHARLLGTAHQCGVNELQSAVSSAVAARNDWMHMDWTDRAAIFLKAADLLAGPWRDTINASTMLGQSKNPYQAEIDAACELIDFFRFNVKFMEQIYKDQPISSPGIWNRVQYRALEGFVFAVTPFNFTSIAGNLPTAPALMGNTVLWKPSSTQLHSAYYLYKMLEEAGLPKGVINMIPGRGSVVGNSIFSSEHFTGLHFTGSTKTFNFMWSTIGNNMETYKTYPRVVGETGGKDFIVAHPSADPVAVGTAIVRGGFEYQGQKCSAASRVYVPASLWPTIKDTVKAQLDDIKMGPVEDFSNFVNAVIDRSAYDSISGYIAEAKASPDVEVVHGGNYSDEVGYFIEPTVLRTTNPKYRTMCEEIFGPVVSIFVYDDDKFDETLILLNDTSPFALTGAVFAQDRSVLTHATNVLNDCAGNFYLNDKPTGAVVGQQPFGGARASGTNDKAGSPQNLLRWTSARSIKETFVPAKDYRYPFLENDPTDIEL
ncbi:MAG: L-glutamate gamma-semialdehyde dehydrogenase [Rhodothermales bacterium]|nr:L-glutamate gamma-semialdehyde dehydrogenase [Rhodothermales bacterium]MDG2017551.1 L-glutamate gamma-semialdehyde dehydrogenase [Rhodothermales bacterium]